MQAMVALGEVPGWWESGGAAQQLAGGDYPMDYYSKDGGPWNSTYHRTPPARTARTPQPVAVR